MPSIVFIKIHNKGVELDSSDHSVTDTDDRIDTVQIMLSIIHTLFCIFSKRFLFYIGPDLRQMLVSFISELNHLIEFNVTSSELVSVLNLGLDVGTLESGVFTKESY